MVAGKCSKDSNKVSENKSEYLHKLEEAISEISINEELQKTFHPISMKFKDPKLEAKVLYVLYNSQSGDRRLHGSKLARSSSVYWPHVSRQVMWVSVSCIAKHGMEI